MTEPAEAEFPGAERTRLPPQWAAPMLRRAVVLLLAASAMTWDPLRAADTARPTGAAPPYSAALVKELLAVARADGDSRRGALVFRSTALACLSCHKVAGQGGTVGPDLSEVARCLPPEEIVESVLWPRRKVKPEYAAVRVVTGNGRSIQGYVKAESDQELTLLEPGTDKVHRVRKQEIE